MRSISVLFIIILSVCSALGQTNDTILSSLKKKYNLTEYDRPTEIITFNKDTILVAGYLADLYSSTPRYEQTTNIIYKTTDGGINWKRTKFNGSAWIYDSHHDMSGNVWMGGSDNYVHYSPDFGETWQRKPEPFVPINRVHSIFMVDSKFGIAGGLHNGLALTFDNWNSVKQIPTPLDQKKFKILSNSSRNKIERVEIIDSTIMINQNEHIYFSKLGKVKWTEFNIPVVDFSIDLKEKEITIQSLNGKYFVLTSNLKLVRSYQEDFIWEEIKGDSISLKTDDFFKPEIKSVNIKSVNWVFDKPGHMIDIYKPITQEISFLKKNGVFQSKSKKHSADKLQFTSTDLTNTFNNSQVNFSLDKVGQGLSFADLDIRNYREFLIKEKQKRKEEKEWGGDFTSLIPLDNQSFITIDSVIRKNNSKHITSVYNHLNYPSSLKINESNKIELVIINDKNEMLKISNENSLLFSLPWTIQIDGQSIRSFNPKITTFIRSILPTDNVNYQMLMGGQLIYELTQEQIIEELEYKNGY